MKPATTLKLRAIQGTTTIRKNCPASLTLGFVFLKLEDVVAKHDQDQKLVKREKSTVAFNVLNS